MKKRNILIGAAVAAALVAIALIYYIKRMKHEPARVITQTEMADLKQGDTLIIDLKDDAYVIFDQSEGKIDLQRIKVRTGDKIEPLAALFPKKTGEQLSSVKMLSVASYATASEDDQCCPDCNIADPSTTCCCCETYIDESGRYSKSCGDFLEPNCKGPTLADCVGCGCE
jgi:hypothetical protein